MPPRSPWRSSSPASAASVQTLIIAILGEEFIQGGALQPAGCSFNSRPSAASSLVRLEKPNSRGASVLKRVKRGPADACLAEKPFGSVGRFRFHPFPPCFFSTFAQLSFRATVRLNTGAPGFESGSAQK